MPPIRILHIGNIANNAYLNARMLNEAGFDCDVICYDYYHIMGCPEWEDADFDETIKDHFAPDWGAIDLKEFNRPAWFAQGSFVDCIDYLEARRCGDTDTEQDLWTDMQHSAPPSARPLWQRGLSRLGRIARRVGIGKPDNSQPTLAAIHERLHRKFISAFPNRTDSLSIDDIVGYASVLPRWRNLMRHYDAVIGYATDGVLPLLIDKRPYYAYEHGTIRNIPFNETTQGRLCSLTYREATGAFITNCDNITSADRLGLKQFQFVPHPVNEAHVPEDAPDLRAAVREQLDADFIIFHPARQHWEERRHPDWEKGNDILIHGLASFIRDVNPRAGAIFVEWGEKLKESKALLQELGIADRVLWIPPQPNRSMVRYVLASDVVADQFFLGAFGSLTPKALMCGRPALLKLDEDRHRWCFPEMPPVLNTGTPGEVADALARLYRNPEWRQEISTASRRWYEQYHSNEVIVGTFREALEAGQTKARLKR
jgi:glycosyltransferase involved in cell wall biosynthesis